MEYTLCPICEVDSSEFFYDKERDNNSVTFVRCKQCGLVYQNPRLSQVEFDEYYKTEFREIRENSDELEEYISSRIKVGHEIYNIVQSKLFSGWRNNLKKLFLGNKGFRILDVGCGVGGILVPFKEVGFRCKGIDTPSYYTQLGKSKLELDIEETFLSEYNPGEKYDVIILNHSLEHFLDPVNELNKIYDLLTETGIVYIEVPDIERPYSWTSYQYFFMLGHVFYYSAQTLETLMKKCGFKRLFIENEDTPFMRNIFNKLTR